MVQTSQFIGHQNYTDVQPVSESQFLLYENSGTQKTACSHLCELFAFQPVWQYSTLFSPLNVLKTSIPSLGGSHDVAWVEMQISKPKKLSSHTCPCENTAPFFIYFLFLFLTKSHTQTSPKQSLNYVQCKVHLFFINFFFFSPASSFSTNLMHKWYQRSQILTAEASKRRKEK